jgi:hypothetical protein
MIGVSDSPEKGGVNAKGYFSSFRIVNLLGLKACTLMIEYQNHFH